MNEATLVSKVWNYAHVLRDQGISYGDYIGQISFLLFLKMDEERTTLLGEPSTRFTQLTVIPAEAKRRAGTQQIHAQRCCSVARGTT